MDVNPHRARSFAGLKSIITSCPRFRSALRGPGHGFTRSRRLTRLEYGATVLAVSDRENDSLISWARNIMKNSTICGTTVFWGSEDGRKYGGESGSGATMKGYQPGETLYLSPWCRTNSPHKKGDDWK